MRRKCHQTQHQPPLFHSQEHQWGHLRIKQKTRERINVDGAHTFVTPLVSAQTSTQVNSTAYLYSRVGNLRPHLAYAELSSEGEVFGPICCAKFGAWQTYLPRFAVAQEPQSLGRWQIGQDTSPLKLSSAQAASGSLATWNMTTSSPCARKSCQPVPYGNQE